VSSSIRPVSVDEIREEMADLETAEERVGYLIELGDTLAPFDDAAKTEDNRVLGCQSMVWLTSSNLNEQLVFSATSDAPMVKGLVAILVGAFSYKSPQQIIDFPILELFDDLQLKTFVSPLRSNGLFSMVQKVISIAQASQAEDQSTAGASMNDFVRPQPTKSIAGCREDFPILSRVLPNGKPLIYLDNAATSQRPASVINAMDEAYEKHFSNVHRSGHALAAETTTAMEESRQSIADFINAASKDEIVFTSGTTASINLVARAWGDAFLQAGDEIILSEMEHHSNIVPWQQLASRTGAIIRWIPITDDFHLDLVAFENALGPRTKIVAITAVSNVLGTINPIRKITDLAHHVGAVVLVDAAQAIPHGDVNVQSMDADFLVFSGHKMLGPTGIGVLYGKRKLLESMPAFLGGGNMIQSVTTEGFTQAGIPHRFEAGTAAIVESIGLKPAVDYLLAIGPGAILQQERLLFDRAMKGLSGLPGVRTFGPGLNDKTGVLTFVVDRVDSQQIAHLLDNQGIAIRVGHHCAMPLHSRLGLGASCRASFYFYNTAEEVDHFIAAMRSIVGTKD
jgi:cysteine desulfurase/selenocysteine lyase